MVSPRLSGVGAPQQGTPPALTLDHVAMAFRLAVAARMQSAMALAWLAAMESPAVAEFAAMAASAWAELYSAAVAAWAGSALGSPPEGTRVRNRTQFHAADAALAGLVSAKCPATRRNTGG